jgi:glutamine amidotransferase
MTENWVNVPTNSVLTIHRQTVMVHPILDKYYERDPAHVRSSAFVQANGLVSNEKSPSGPLTPSHENHGSLDSLRKNTRSLSPDLARRSINPVLPRDPATLPHRALQQVANGQLSKQTVAQGGRKDKRRSLQHGEMPPARNSVASERSSDGNERARVETQNTTRLSQYFPELALTSHAS